MPVEVVWWQWVTTVVVVTIEGYTLVVVLPWWHNKKLERVRSQGNGGKRFYLLLFFFRSPRFSITRNIRKCIFIKNFFFAKTTNKQRCMHDSSIYIYIYIFSIRLASKNVPSPGSPCHPCSVLHNGALSLLNVYLLG